VNPLTGTAIAWAPHNIAAAFAVKEGWRLSSWVLLVHCNPAAAKKTFRYGYLQ